MVGYYSQLSLELRHAVYKSNSVIFQKVSTWLITIPPVCCSSKKYSFHVLALVVSPTPVVRLVKVPLMTSSANKITTFFRKTQIQLILWMTRNILFVIFLPRCLYVYKVRYLCHHNILTSPRTTGIGIQLERPKFGIKTSLRNMLLLSIQCTGK